MIVEKIIKRFKSLHWINKGYVFLFLLNPLLYDFYLFIFPDFDGKTCRMFQTGIGILSLVMILFVDINKIEKYRNRNK